MFLNLRGRELISDLDGAGFACLRNRQQIAVMQEMGHVTIKQFKQAYAQVQAGTFKCDMATHKRQSKCTAPDSNVNEFGSNANEFR